MRDVYAALHAQDRLENIDVQHNVTLTGKSGATHQIDVYWKFELADQQYQTCVECKHYTSPVKKAHVAAFVAVLQDLRISNGIVVTSSGFQRGARLLAENHSVRLVVATPTIQKVEISGTLLSPDIRDFTLQFDEPRSKEILQRAGTDVFSYLVRGADVRLRRGDGPELDLGPLLQPHLTTDGHKQIDLYGYSIKTEYGWLPLLGATFDVEIFVHKQEMRITASDAVIAILEDVLTNTMRYIRDTGSGDKGR